MAICSADKQKGRAPKLVKSTKSELFPTAFAEKEI